MSSMDTPTNDILSRLNRLYEAKLSGGLDKKELAEEIIKVGDLIANSIRIGKISDNNVIEDIESHLPNQKYFRFSHEGINEANNTVKEGIEMSLSERDKRFSGVVKGLKF